VFIDASRGQALWSIVELSQTVQKFEKRYGMSLREFEQRNLLDESGHTWKVEENYYERDTGTTELQKFKELLEDLE